METPEGDLVVEVFDHQNQCVAGLLRLQGMVLDSLILQFLVSAKTEKKSYDRTTKTFSVMFTEPLPGSDPIDRKGY